MEGFAEPWELGVKNSNRITCIRSNLLLLLHHALSVILTFFFFLSVCRARLDLAFLIDGSGSIERSGRGNFRRCLNFVKRMVSSFKVSPSYTRVGVTLFSSRTWLVFGFNRFRNKRQIYRAIDRIRYPSGGTRIGSALRFVKYRLFQGSRRRKVGITKLNTLRICLGKESFSGT